jgi:hypothetical protein
MEDEIPLILERASDEPENVPAIAVGFGLRAVQDKGASERDGYPVFKEREYVSLRVPGDKNTHSFRPSKEKDRERYPKAYAAFKNRNSTVTTGFPIEHWPQITRGEALTLKAMSIHSVESLAEVHDGHIEKLGHSGRQWRTKAKAFLAQAKDTAEAQRLATENERKDAEMAELRRQIADLAAKLEQPAKTRGKAAA